MKAWWSERKVGFRCSTSCCSGSGTLLAVHLRQSSDEGDSYLAFARDFEDMGAVGVYTPWQTENKLSNTYFLTSFLLTCLTNSHCYERSVPPCGKGVTGGKEGQWRCLMCKHWAYDQQCLHWTTNLCFAFQAEQETIRFTDYYTDPKTSMP